MYNLHIAWITSFFSFFFIHARWVDKGLGRFLGFHNAWWNICSNLVDNALYPILCVDYLFSFFVHEPASLPGTVRILVAWSVIIGVATLNWYGVDLVGLFNLWLAVMVMAPFALLMVIGLYYIWTAEPGQLHCSSVLDPNPFVGTTRRIALHQLVLSVLWNASGWDSAATIADDVDEPRRTYPKVFLFTALLMIASYTIVITISACVYGHYSDWMDGTFVTVAHQIGGVSLAFLVSLAGAISAIGTLNTTMCSAVHMIIGSANIRVAPKAFQNPGYAIVFNCVLTAPFCVFSFRRVQELSMAVQAFTYILSVLGWVALHTRERTWPWPYSLGNHDVDSWIRKCMAVFPLSICVVMLWTSKMWIWMSVLVSFNCDVIAFCRFCLFVCLL
jgi:amino acid transporter